MLDNYEQIIEQIKKANNVLITFPASKNGEAIAGGLALASVLSKQGKNAEILSDLETEDPYIQKQNKTFSFLPGYNKIKTSIDSLRKFVISLDLTNTKVKQVKYRMESDSLKFFITPQKGVFTPEEVTAGSTEAAFDLVITLNTPDMEALGSVYEDDPELFYNTPIINIDNNSANEEFGEINLVGLTAPSTAEILYNLFQRGLEEEVDEDVATCLLSGIIYKTKSFKTLNITPHTLSITSELISQGARREEIMNELYRSKDINVLKLWGRVLARLSGSRDNKLIWSSVLKTDLEKTQAQPSDLADIIDELISNIPQAKISVIFYEIPAQEEAEHPGTGVLMYAPKNIDLLEVMEDYSPQGNKRMVEIRSDSPLQDSKKEIIEHLERKIEELDV